MLECESETCMTSVSKKKMLFKVFDQHLACLRQRINSCKDVISYLPTNLRCSLHIHSKHPYSFCKLHCLDLHSVLAELYTDFKFGFVLCSAISVYLVGFSLIFVS